MNQSFTISWSTISKIILAVIFVYIFYLIKDILIWFVFALILGTLFNYVIDILEKKRVPRLISAGVLYGGVFALASFFVYQTAPIILKEVNQFSDNLPAYLQRLSPLFEKIGIETFRNKESFFNGLQAGLNQAGQNPFSALVAIFGSVTSTVLVLSVAFFMSLERGFVLGILDTFSPAKYHHYLTHLWLRAKKKVSGWFITRVIGVIFVGSATYLAMRLLNTPYSLILAVFAGIFDLVPLIGPIAAGFIIFVVVSLYSLPQAIFILIIFVVIQLLENNLLFPILFKKFIGVSPVLVLFALAVGAKLWGALGAILAIPLAAVFLEILKDYLSRVAKKNLAKDNVLTGDVI